MRKPSRRQRRQELAATLQLVEAGILSPTEARQHLGIPGPAPNQRPTPRR